MTQKINFIADVTQLVECQLPKLNVAGSTPVVRFFCTHIMFREKNLPPPVNFCSTTRPKFYLRQFVITNLNPGTMKEYIDNHCINIIGFSHTVKKLLNEY